ncbi:MBL fold metallo-hydrolase [Candidatus Dojkabacteria bacterium]|nr:MBL fold metallo-hydrolase [Candidatus Dojkabacteria bacterium]
MRNEKLLIKICGILTALIAVISYLIFSSPSGNLEIFILDIGQGDAILIKTADNKYILVDAGPDDSVIQELQDVIPFWDRTLDLVILTHPDQDHVGGMPFVFDYYDVDAVSFLPFEDGNEAFRQFQQDVKEGEIGNWKLDSQKDFSLGCCTYFDMLWPTFDIYEECDVEIREEDKRCMWDVNDASAAFVLVYKDFAMYFGGDLPSKYEEQIFAGSTYDLDAIKVGHHGSKTSTSTEFLELTHPEKAYVSVGKDNKFGHPHQETLDNLKQFGIEVHRTDVKGRIAVEY